MAPVLLPLVSVIVTLTLVTSTSTTPKDECADLFFTPAWRDCFRNRFKSTWAFNPLQDQSKSFPFHFPQIPNVNDLIEEAKAKGKGGGPVASSSAMSSGDGTGSSTSLMSFKGRTWTVESDGLSVSTSDIGGVGSVKLDVGEPVSIINVFGEDNSIRVNLKYGGAQRWVKITLDSPTKAKDLKINNEGGMLSIEGPM